MARTLASLIALALAASPVQAGKGAARATPAAASKAASLAAATAANAAFLDAKKAYLSLKKDEKRRKYRDQWLAVAERFETVAQKYPGTPRAADALYDAADLYSELSRVSLARGDLKKAIESYGRLCETYPRSSLADDAHMALGRIYRDRKGDVALAAAEFRAAAACRGDQQSKAKLALAELPKVEPKLETPKPVEKPAARPEAKLAEKSEKPERSEKLERSEKVESKAAAATLASRAASITLATRDEEDDEDEVPEASIPLKAGAPAAPAALDPNRVKALKEASQAEVPLSVQVGLKVKRVVIDPGHGGVDDGATGPTGLKEKDATLAISLKLKEKLEKQGYEVLLTREMDRFVSLEDRARFANRSKGDLFVSVHCNAYKDRKLRGTETYTLNVTSDRYAIRLAARENAASERTLSDLQFILADLATKANTDESRKLARAVQSELISAQEGSKGKVRDLGVKQALFYVLLGAKMPSVLVETAFISNPEDEKLLADAGHQQEFASAIAEGIERFTAEREALAAAATE